VDIFAESDGNAPFFLVLLSCFEGAAFLPALLDSIIGQDYPNFGILIRDDDSGDGTPALIKEFAECHKGRVSVVSSKCKRRLGPRESFRQLLEEGLRVGDDIDFFFFADQDDVWLPHKLASFARRIQEDAEAERPALLHSDLRVVGRELELIHQSYLRYQGLDPRANRPGNLALVNTVTGCATAINRALAKLCVEMPAEAVMHDWWAALLASVYGRVLYIDEALVLYRQHGANTLGARRYERGSVAERIKRQWQNERREYFEAVARQSRALLRVTPIGHLPWIDRWQLRLVAGLDRKGLGARLWRLSAHRALARMCRWRGA
jgi:glycosyltransferase involved in cell wall biosynthesis